MINFVNILPSISINSAGGVKRIRRIMLAGFSSKRQPAREKKRTVGDSYETSHPLYHIISYNSNGRAINSDYLYAMQHENIPEARELNTKIQGKNMREITPFVSAKALESYQKQEHSSNQLPPHLNFLIS